MGWWAGFLKALRGNRAAPAPARHYDPADWEGREAAKARGSTRQAPAEGVVRLAGTRPAFGYDIVGESHYQDALSEICGGRTRGGVEHACVAVLTPEPDNPYDPNAVAVMIDGQLVGRLRKEHARVYVRRMAALGVGDRVISCDAQILGGWDRGPKGKGHFGVMLDLRWPARLRGG